MIIHTTFSTNNIEILLILRKCFEEKHATRVFFPF